MLEIHFVSNETVLGDIMVNVECTQYKNGKVYYNIELTHDEFLFFSQFFLFADIDAKLLKKAVNNADTKLVSYQKGNTIESADLGFILSGKIEARQNNDGSLLLRDLHAGDVFGIANLFRAAPSPLSHLQAKEKTRVLYLSRNFLAQEMAQNPKLMENYICFLEGRIVFLNQRIANLTKHSTEEALLTLLHEEAKGCTAFTLDSSIQTLSRKLNISRASLYRAFDTLIEKGFIQKNGKTITITQGDYRTP